MRFRRLRPRDMIALPQRGASFLSADHGNLAERGNMAYFQSVSRRPYPAGFAAPARPLADYESMSDPDASSRQP